jgi:AcrR family transcriptional regulator
MFPGMDTTAVKPLRADAERNRRRLLDAAAACFAEQGLDVSVGEIARRAGVGHGTAFRRFPTKERLICEVVLDRIEGLVAAAAELLERDGVDDPLRAFAELMLERQVADRGLAQAVDAGVLADPAVGAAHAELLATVGRLVRRAQEAGRLRDDVSAIDVLLLTKGVVAAADPLLDVTPRVWRRYLDLVFDGLRPDAATPLSVRPPTRAELERGFALRPRC